MNLHEYQAKQLFVRYGSPAPADYVCTTSREAEGAALEIGVGPQVVKCQVHVGGRSEAGGVKVVNSKEDIRTFAENWLDKCLVTYQTGANGQPVNQILIEVMTDITKELYLDVVVDRSSRRMVFMVSTEDGVEIEKVVEEAPYLIHKVAPDSLTGPTPYQGRELALKLDLEGKLVQQFVRIFMGLVAILLERDLTPIEIDPLVITKQGDLIRLGGKLDADGDALFRQPDPRKMRDQSQEDPREAQTTQWELNYVAPDGDIGYMVSDVGLAMGMMDIVRLHGGGPANFLDVGGDATRECATETFKIILSNDKVKTILVSIFGSIVRCGPIADGIIGMVVEAGVNVPIAVRLESNNAELGAKKLADSGLNITAAKGLTNAAQ